MKVNDSRPLFAARATVFAGLALASLLPAVALAGPDSVYVTPRFEPRPSEVVTVQKKTVNRLLIACGVLQPPPIEVAPGYLETRGPAPMMVYRPPAPMHPRRVTRPVENDEKPAASPAANPAPSPGAKPAPTPALPAPILAPAPVDPEPGLLPETGPGGSTGPNPTDEMLSYFQRQRPVHRPGNPLDAPNNGALPNDPREEPSFLQAPQAPEQPVLPPSRATYHVTP